MHEGSVGMWMCGGSSPLSSVMQGAQMYMQGCEGRGRARESGQTNARSLSPCSLKKEDRGEHNVLLSPLSLPLPFTHKCIPIIHPPEDHPPVRVPQKRVALQFGDLGLQPLLDRQGSTHVHFLLGGALLSFCVVREVGRCVCMCKDGGRMCVV